MDLRMTVEHGLLWVSIVAVFALEELAGVPALVPLQQIFVLRGEVAFGTSEWPKLPWTRLSVEY